MEFTRANSEAEHQEIRSDENWKMKKGQARESQKVMTSAVPAWIAKRDRDVPKVHDKKTGKVWQSRKRLVLRQRRKV